MTIGERIRNRRKELGLTVDELAEKLGKNRATIYRYESNEIEKLPTTVLEPLAVALGVTPGYFMGWDEKNAPTETEPGRSKEKEIEKILRNLSDSELDKVAEFIAFLLSQRKGEK